MAKRIAILGSTGSIGRNALRVIDALGEDYEVTALSAHRNVELLAEQAKRFRPAVAVVSDEDYYRKFTELSANLDIETIGGAAGLQDIVQRDDIDVVVSAIVGAAGLEAVLAAAQKGKRIAIANKEPLVIAGELLMNTVASSGAQILPIDSEHSAIFQAMQAGAPNEVSRIILTASGGPFRRVSADEMENVTLAQALAHPVWDMGPKITIDSATMMNKALEVIEAKWLFDKPVEQINILIHPQSVIHSMVEFVDGSIMAQLGTPDMCTPIQYALTYPRRSPGLGKKLKLDELANLSFESPDFEVFRSLVLGYEVARQGGTAPVVFNAANEAAVELFLDGRIKFVKIIELIEHCLNKHDLRHDICLEELLEVDAWARKEVNECLNHKVH